jgi:hypothetical protein
MIITKEMFDEFVESAENQNILWTDTLALIGVTVGDVPDVDVIEAQAAEIARLREDCQRARVLLLKPWSSEDVEDARFILGATLAQETQP